MNRRSTRDSHPAPFEIGNRQNRGHPFLACLLWVATSATAAIFVHPLGLSSVALFTIAFLAARIVGDAAAILPVIALIATIEGTRLLRHPAEGHDPNSLIYIVVIELCVAAQLGAGLGILARHHEDASRLGPTNARRPRRRSSCVVVRGSGKRQPAVEKA